MRKVVDEVCERMADLCSEIQTSGMQVENGRGIAAVVVLFPIASIDSHPVELTATDARTLWKLADGVFRDWSKTPAEFGTTWHIREDALRTMGIETT